MTESVVTTVDGGVATVTLNRPEARNAISGGVRDGLADAFYALGGNSSIRAIVLTGAGDRAFCAGVDREDLPAMIASLADLNAAPQIDAATIVARSPVPVIAAVNGVAVTGGLELMLACDFSICADHARFADTHARLGIAALWGMSVRLPRRIGVERAKQMCLTGQWVDASQAAAWGLVNAVVPGANLAESAHEIAAAISRCDPDAVAFVRRQLEDGVMGAFSEALVRETSAASEFNKTRPSRRDGGPG